MVVCCYNSSEVIAPTIESLARQEVPGDIGYEVILVDNNCTDNTVALAERTWNHPVGSLKIVKEREPGLINARKRGVHEAKYDILLFIDDDNILDGDWIPSLYELYRRFPGVGAIGGHIEPLFEGIKPGWFDDFAGVYACKAIREESAILTEKKFLFGAGLSFRTAVIRSIFYSELPLILIGRKNNVLLRGEDGEMCMRAILMGWDLWYEHSLKLKHYLLKRRVNWEYVLKARKGGGAAEIYLRIYRNLIDGKLPPDYRSLSYQICRKWRDFWENLEDMAEIRREGSKKGFEYSYLQGLSETLLDTKEEDYNQIRKKIIEFFPI